MTLSVGVSYSSFQVNYGYGFNELSNVQLKTAQSLLSQFDGFLDAAPGRQPLPQELMLAPPSGYMRGGGSKALAAAAGFLAGLQAAAMMNISMGSRALLGLSLFRSSALMGGSAQFSIMNINVGGPINTQGPREKDPFAVHESCRTGADNPSNLNNSPHVKLALHNILKGNHDNMPPDQLKKRLEDDYGIKSEITTVKGNDGRDLKALKFENGDMLVDGSGNGSFGMADYNLKGAVKDIQEKYGITPEQFDEQAKANKASGGAAYGGFGGVGDGLGNFGGQDFNIQIASFQAQFASAMPYMNFQTFFPARELSQIFAQAWAFADA